MARTPSLIARIRDALRPATRPQRGGQVQPARNVRRARTLTLPFETPIVRKVLRDYQLTRNLCEMREWSPEGIGSIDYLSRDPFQQLGGETGSWFVSPTKDGSEDGSPTHPDVLAIAEEVRSRLFRREYVLGGDRLQSLLQDSMWFGDGYGEMEISRDGTGNYVVSRLVDREPLTIFHKTDDNSSIEEYLLKPSEWAQDEDILRIPWWKVLHISRGGQNGGYGKPLLQSQVYTGWEPLKATAQDMLDVIRAAGTAPWVHTFGKETEDTEKEKYILNIQQERESGILVDLFLNDGGKVARAGGADGSIKAILEAKNSYRAQMVPAGVPLHLFPGLDVKSGSQKDLSSQPALNHARAIASTRSKLGEQIKWAITLEIVLAKGYDFFRQEGQFEVAWPKWFVTGMESDIQSEGRADSETGASSSGPTAEATIKRLDAMMGQLEEKQQSLIKLSNVGRLIQEVQENG